jgi:hypothetical protein
MLRVGNKTKDFLYEWVDAPVRRKTRRSDWNPHMIISDEQYEINLKYLCFTYELFKLAGKPRDPMPREALVDGIMELCEYDPEIKDAKQLHQIEKITDSWD